MSIACHLPPEALAQVRAELARGMSREERMLAGSIPHP